MSKLKIRIHNLPFKVSVLSTKYNSFPIQFYDPFVESSLLCSKLEYNFVFFSIFPSFWAYPAFFPVMIARCWRIVSLSTDGSQPMNNLWVEGDFLVPVLKTKNAFTRISLWLLFQGISVIFPPSFTVFWPDVCDITQISKEIWPSFFLQSEGRGGGRGVEFLISDKLLIC